MNQRKIFQPKVIYSVLFTFLTAALALGGGNAAAQQPWQIFAEQVKKETLAERSGVNSPLAEQEEQPENNYVDSPDNPSSQVPPSNTDFASSEPAPSDLPPSESSQAAAPIPLPLSPPPYRSLPRMKNDATLHDVYFLDARRGWAVGDRGTVWTTRDGGKQWFLADTPVTDDLYAVQFLNENFGVAVGGSVLPGGENGRGVILLTDDGGATWTSQPCAAFPILRSVQIRSRGEIVVAGDSSELYPAGIFLTLDGGATWQPAERTNRHSGWRKLAYRSEEKRGIGPACDGSFLRYAGGKTTADGALASESVADLSQTTAGYPLWLAGERGLVLRSDDSGENWRRPEGVLPPNAADLFDFSTVFASGDRVLLAGTPGSRLFLSEDGGRNWESVATGITVPIRRLFFVDALHGWGVGALGNIIATTDGGRSWTVQREGGRRLAFLALLADNDSFCPELFLRLAGDEGYLGAAAALFRPKTSAETEEEISPLQRLDAATVEACGCGAFGVGRFFAPEAERSYSLESILARLDAENDGRGLEKFRERLVRMIRTLRPDVLVIQESKRPIHGKIAAGGGDALEKIAEYTRSLDARPVDPLRELIERELPGAILAAQNPEMWPEQISSAGLAPWSVEKVERISSDPEGNIRLNTADFSPILGRSIAQMARDARSLLGVKSVNGDGNPPSDPVLATLYDRRGETKQAAVFAGRELPYGSEARRIAAAAMTIEGLDLRERFNQRRQLLGVVEKLANSTADGPAKELLLADLDRRRQTLDPELAVEYLSRTGEAFARSGDWTQAEEVFSRIARDYPDQPSARTALLWLVQFYAGSEPFWRTQDGNRIVSSGGPVGAGEVNAALAIDPAQTDSRFHNADELGRLIRARHPELYMTPELRFPLAVVQRRRGYDNDALRYFLNRSLVSKDDLWGARSKAEFLLMAPNVESMSPEEQISPLLTASCRTTAERPYLDGTLEEGVWKNAARFSLSQRPLTAPPKNLDAAPPTPRTVPESIEFGTFVSLLYDSQYLYIGVESSKVEGVAYPPSETPRRRDADLSGEDRIEIELDFDRDYTTCYRFVFSRFGDVTDSCWDRLDWDAKIFTAQNETESGWTLEAAIPWEALCERPPTKNDILAAAFRRIVPDRGVECWNVENSNRTEHAFGHLTFGLR